MARMAREYLSKEEGARWVVILGGAGQFCGMSGFRSYMDVALEEARAAGARGEVPVGAVIVAPDGTVAARAATGRGSYPTPPRMPRYW